MHPIHHTDALVLSGRNVGEAHRYLTLLTREFGVVRAHAKSAREEKSKLRYGLQELMFSRVALVRGRDTWRVTGAHELWSVHAALAKRHPERALAARLARLVERLVAGEEASPHLYDTLRASLTHLARVDLPEEERFALEAVTVLRVLYLLGYVDRTAQNAVFAPHIDTIPELSSALLREAAPQRKRMIKTINTSLTATGM